MSDSSGPASRLPARPSLEQLQKQAKELVRQSRVAGTGPTTLADAQFMLAREYGFETWAKLKHHIEALQPSGLEPFEKLAQNLATAYSTADVRAIRELNWSQGTSFIWYHEPEKMHQRLPTWFASEARTADLALADARRLVALSYGFGSWAEFGASGAPPLYKIDSKENTISVRGPVSEKDWDRLCDVMTEFRIARLRAGGMTDAGMERIARLDHVTQLELGNSNRLTDDGLRHLARMPQLRELDLGGPTGVFTDGGLEVLRHLRELRRFGMCWQGNVSDTGLANLAFCVHLESVDLLGTPTGDGAIQALTGKPKLRHLKTGHKVTDAGLALLHRFPAFKTWQGGDINFGLMSFAAGPTHLLVDGPFTDAGLATLAGLDGLVGLTFFWHCPAFTSAGLAPLKDLANLSYLGCQGERCDDEAMRHIAEFSRLRMLMAQGTVATDAGFAALSRSQTIEHIWGRECPNLTGRGFSALAAMPALRGLAVSCKNVDDAALSTLPRFPALREFMPMDVPDEGFRHVGACEQLERLTCMYCRETGDVATGHIAGLSRLKSYYAGSTKITDRSLEILGRMQSLESLEFWGCAGVTDAGVAHLAGLPLLKEITLDGMSGVTRAVEALFPERVRLKYSG